MRRIMRPTDRSFAVIVVGSDPGDRHQRITAQIGDDRPCAGFRLPAHSQFISRH